MPIYYDVCYPKKGQLTLMCNGHIIANGKNKTYLLNRMKVAQDEFCKLGIQQENTYQIVDMFQDCLVLNTFQYKTGEMGNGKKRAPQGKKINFVEINSIRPMSYSRTYAIADDNDTIITDMELLGLLYDFRYINTLPCEITNKSLAYFATYPPTTKESFVKSYGVGEAVYIKCGEKILDFIINYLDKKSHNK